MHIVKLLLFEREIIIFAHELMIFVPYLSRHIRYFLYFCNVFKQQNSILHNI